MNYLLDKPINKTTKIITALLGSLALFLVTFSASYAYEAEYEEFSISSGYNTAYNEFPYSSTYGSGYVSKKDYVYKSGSSVTLEALIIDHDVYKGDPYYSQAYVERKGSGSVVYLDLGSVRHISDGERVIWRPYVSNPMSSTIYFHDSNIAGASTQYRAISIFNY
jgi:hypothetical protein